MRSMPLAYIVAPLSLRILQPKVSEYSSGEFPFYVFPFPSPYAYAPPCRFSLYFIALYLLRVFLSGSLTRLYMDLSIGESIDISGPQGEYIFLVSHLMC